MKYSKELALGASKILVRTTLKGSITRRSMSCLKRACLVCLMYNYATIRDMTSIHDDVIKWKHFPRNWPFVREIHRSPVNFPHKGQWRGALMFSLIYAWINDWVNNREAGDLRRQHGHYDVIVMTWAHSTHTYFCIAHTVLIPLVALMVLKLYHIKYIMIATGV